MSNPLALEGIRVMDLSRMLPGPYGTMLLADLGADVIRVENPEVMDTARLAPPLMGGVGAMYLMVNRNKRSISLNLKHEQGRAVFLDLVRTADVVIEQFRPGVMQALGLGYDALRAIRPDLIYCSLSGFGQDGPYRLRPGHDINYVSLAGLTDATRGADGKPTVPGFPVADLVGGIFAAFYILAALLARQRTGEGRYLDVALADAVVSLASPLLAEAAVGDAGGSELLLSSFFRQSPFYGIYRTSDGGYVSIGAIEPAFWTRLCEALGRPDLASQQYAVGDEAQEISRQLAEIFDSRTRAEWERELGNLDVMFAPVKSMAEMLEDHQVLVRGLIGSLEHPEAGFIPQVRSPVRLGDADCLRMPPPEPGQHGEEILRELGYSESQLKELADANVI